MIEAYFDIQGNVLRRVRNKEAETASIPYGITQIADHAFAGCRNLRRVTMPDSVVSIGQYVFGSCDKLASVTLSKRLTSIGENAFNGCRALTSIQLPASVVEIKRGAFNGCQMLTSVDIPNGVKVISDFLFNACSALARVTLPSRITSLGRCAFCNCSSLTGIRLPAGIPKINYETFQGSGLTSVTIPEGVEYICAGAFENCKSLKSIQLPTNHVNIDCDAFRGCGPISGLTYNGRGLKLYIYRKKDHSDTPFVFDCYNRKINYTYGDDRSIRAFRLLRYIRRADGKEGIELAVDEYDWEGDVIGTKTFRLFPKEEYVYSRSVRVVHEAEDGERWETTRQGDFKYFVLKKFVVK